MATARAVLRVLAAGVFGYCVGSALHQMGTATATIVVGCVALIVLTVTE